MDCKAIAAAIALITIGCASDRYAWNLKHAYVTPQAHLQPGDLEQIVKLVTDATQEPIVNITRPFRDRKRSGQVDVLTGYPNGTGGHSFTLEKRDSKWRIIQSGGLIQ
jgi:hypothetical protein